MSTKEKTLDIEGYGQVVLKKLSWKEKCALRGKSLKVALDSTGQPMTPELDMDAISMWLLVYSIKSIPSYKDFYKFNDDNKKLEIVGDFGLGEGEPDDLGEQIFTEANVFNSINPVQTKKK